MKNLLVIPALVVAGGFAPALAQDQGDPNPPAIQQEQGAPGKPAIAQEPQGGPPAVTQASPPPPPAKTEIEPGDTSGPAAGTPVEPPTVVQKDNPLIPDITPPGVSGPSGTAAGAPGIEGKKGTQAGKEWLPPEELRRGKPGS